MSIARKFSKKALAFDVYPHIANHSAALTNTGTTGLLIPPQKSLIFLHGILGSKRNWRTPANVFRKLHPDFKCFAVDLRGHGDSHTTDDSNHKWEENTVHNSAQDLHDLIQDTHIGDVKVPTILCAHSFGGKVALKYLERLYLSGHDLPNHTWIIDSLPGPYIKVRHCFETLNFRKIALVLILSSAISSNFLHTLSYLSTPCPSLSHSDPPSFSLSLCLSVFLYHSDPFHFTYERKSNLYHFMNQ